MDISLYTLFLMTTVILIMVPGPAAIMVATQGASQTSHKAFFTVLGVASADVLFFALSAMGIASIIVASHVMFSIIKWLGVLYLLYLGLSALLTTSAMIKLTQKRQASSRKKLFSQGLMVQLANPKALMYFTALLPQFIDPSHPVLFQFMVMGATSLLADILIYSGFSFLGASMTKQPLKPWMIKLINKVAGGTLIVMGLKMASLEYDK